MKKDSRGFSVLFVLVILLVLCLLAFAGWKVRENQQKENEKPEAAQEYKEDRNNDGEIEDQNTYTARDKSFSIKYPIKYLDKKCESDSSTYIGLALTSEGLLWDCEAQPKPVFGSTIDFSSYPNPPIPEEIEREAYDSELSYTTSKVFIKDKEAIRVEIIYQQDDFFNRESETRYHFNNGKVALTAEYTKLRNTEDLSTDFEAMVSSLNM